MIEIGIPISTSHEVDDEGVLLTTTALGLPSGTDDERWLLTFTSATGSDVVHITESGAENAGGYTVRAGETYTLPGTVRRGSLASLILITAETETATVNVSASLQRAP